MCVCIILSISATTIYLEEIEFRFIYKKIKFKYNIRRRSNRSRIISVVDHLMTYRNASNINFGQVEENLAKELARRKAERERDTRDLLKVCEESDDLKRLKDKINQAYLNKERIGQLTEKQARDHRVLDEDTQMEAMILHKREEELRQNARIEEELKNQRFEHKRQIQTQMKLREDLKVEAHREYVREQDSVREAVMKMIADDQAAREKYEEMKKVQCVFMKKAYEDKAKMIEDEKQANRDLDAKILEHMRLEAVRADEQRNKQAAEDQAKEERYMMLEENERIRKEKGEEIENLINQLSYLEFEERERGKERLEREKKERMKHELQDYAKYQEGVNTERREQEIAQEKRFKEMMLSKFAEDDKLEQKTNQMRRMKELEHKQAVERLWQERLEVYRLQRAEELEEKERKEREEIRKEEIVQKERQRLLEEYNDLLVKYNPKAAAQEKTIYNQTYGSTFMK